MKRIINSAVVSAMLLVAGSGLVTPVFAQTKVEEKTQNVRCSVWHKRVDERVNHYNNKKDAHIANYNRAKDKLNAYLDKLDNQGYDTTLARADAKVLDDKIVDMGIDYATFIKKLEETQTIVCGSSNGEYKSSLKEAKDLLKIVRQDARDIRSYYQTVIKPDIQAIKNQKPSPLPTATSSATQSLTQ